MMGGALAAPTVLGVMQGCSAKPELTWTPQLFTEDQARTVSSIADIILPKTDSPSASELGVPGFIEDNVRLIMTEEERKKFMDLMAEWDTECQESTGKTFNDLTVEEQKQFVSAQHDKITQGWIAPEDRPLIWPLKELTITGYFTTEVGMTQVLQYVAIPTRYDACISLEEAGGKTWAT